MFYNKEDIVLYQHTGVHVQSLSRFMSTSMLLRRRRIKWREFGKYNPTIQKRHHTRKQEVRKIHPALKMIRGSCYKHTKAKKGISPGN